MRQKTITYDVPEGRVKKSATSSDMELTLDVGHNDSFDAAVRNSAENTYTTRRNNTLCDYSDTDWIGNTWLLVEDAFDDSMSATFDKSAADRYADTTVVIADVRVTAKTIVPSSIMPIMVKVVARAMREL